MNLLPPPKISQPNQMEISAYQTTVVSPSSSSPIAGCHVCSEFIRYVVAVASNGPSFYIEIYGIERIETGTQENLADIMFMGA